MINKDPVNGVVMNELFKFFLVIRVESGGDVFVVILRRFLPDVKSTIENGLRKAIPEEARATVSPRIVIPTPECMLGEIGNTGIWILFLKEIKEIGVFLRRSLAHRRRYKMTREGWGGVDEEKEREGEGGSYICKTVVEEREEVKDEYSTNREENGETEAERQGEFSERRAEEFADKGEEIKKDVAAEKKEEAGEGGKD